jgi:hypothetical protein
MIGLTLSAEQVRGAPPEVRRWLEQQMRASFGFAAPEQRNAEALAARLVGCNPEEAAKILELVQGMLPVVNVFFELGREAISVPVHGMRAFRLGDLAQHTRLASTEQVVECLDVLTAALRRVRGDVAALFYLLDEHDHCLVAEPTMRSVLHIWQDIVARRALDIPSEPQRQAQAEQIPA